jgi:hypothetical protein
MKDKTAFKQTKFKILKMHLLTIASQIAEIYGVLLQLLAPLKKPFLDETCFTNN